MKVAVLHGDQIGCLRERETEGETEGEMEVNELSRDVQKKEGSCI